jgi:hypothetical protein
MAARACFRLVACDRRGHAWWWPAREGDCQAHRASAVHTELTPERPAQPRTNLCDVVHHLPVLV